MAESRRNRPGRNTLTDDDLLDIKQEFFVVLSDENIEKVKEIFSNPKNASLLHSGRCWSWDDTEVRDELADLLGIIDE
jgi:hypothetical protein